MKTNLPVTDREVKLKEGEEIISTTDLKGRITSVNQTFLNISGFSEEELIGKSHNIVRHPDMPPVAFANLWDDLKAGKAWRGIVKNRCKNGDFYWVDAFVTPTYQAGQVVGYESVRVCPEDAVLKRAERLYAAVNDGSSRPMGLQFSIKWASMMVAVLCAVLLTGVGVLLGASLWPMLGAGMFGAVISAALIGISFKPLAQASLDTKRFADNGLIQYVFTDRTDDVGQLKFAVYMLQAKLRTVLGRVKESSHQVEHSAGDMLVAVEQTQKNVLHQQSETQMVASAMEEMTATVQEVAKNASQTAHAATDADDGVKLVQSVLGDTVNSINTLASSMEESGRVIGKLDAESENIRTVLDVIGSIADQTNLLALNAAIEAARAGDQGRGFAVVAEEVRSLALRTQDSTVEIQQMVELLHSCSQEANSVMKKGLHQTNDTVQQADRTNQELEGIAAKIGNINEMNLQIASAVEEQSQVAEEINRNLSSIHTSVESTSEQASQSYNSCQHMADRAKHMHDMVLRFKA